MNVVRLAEFIAHKYELLSEGAPSTQIVAEVKRELINAYKLYVNSQTAKDPVLQMLADAGESFSKTFITMFERLIASIDQHNNSILFFKLNNMLGMINEMKNDKTFPVRSFIHDAVRVTKESERNYRERLKSKFEMVMSRLSSILEREAKKLMPTLPKGVPTELEGGVVDPQRAELSKDKLQIFMKTPAAQFYGLDNIDVMTQMLMYPEVRDKVTTLVNAIDRGHIPADGPEVMAKTREIKSWLDNKKTNVSALENNPSFVSTDPTLFEEEKEESK